MLLSVCQSACASLWSSAWSTIHIIITARTQDAAHFWFSRDEVDLRKKDTRHIGTHTERNNNSWHIIPFIHLLSTSHGGVDDNMNTMQTSYHQAIQQQLKGKAVFFSFLYTYVFVTLFIYGRFWNHCHPIQCTIKHPSYNALFVENEWVDTWRKLCFKHVIIFSVYSDTKLINGLSFKK